MSKFRLGETYFNGFGNEVRIICVDANANYNGNSCSIVGLLTAMGGKQPSGACIYSEAGRYCGMDGPQYAQHNLIPDEPDAEEAELIRQIGDICEGSCEDRQKAMLKVIRQLRKK